MPDTLRFGTPTRAHLQLINQNSICDKLFAQLVAYPFPANSSKATREELNALVGWTNGLSDEDLERYVVYDNDLYEVFRDLCLQPERQTQWNKQLDSLFADLQPLVYKLKYHYNRPRPRQLAEHYKLRLFPFDSNSADTPAYPCGAALMAKVVSEVMGNTFPAHYGYCKRLYTDVAYSRQYMGLNYPSDIDAALIGAEAVLKDPEFKLKYRL